MRGLLLLFAALVVSLAILSLFSTPRPLAGFPGAQSPAPRGSDQNQPQTAAAAIGGSLVYNFNAPGVLNEAGSMQESTSPYWWLDSGGELVIPGGYLGETMQGDAPLLNRWRIAYALTNPRDTDAGAHPQNLFRLVTKSLWNDAEVQASFLIAKDDLSSSPNRNQSNGLLLMTRYTGDGQTLYYAGVRVDGTAVIKKKCRGAYYTLAQAQIFPGVYSIAPAPGASQNLLPHDRWIALKVDTVTNADGSVGVALFMRQADGAWRQLLSVRDAGGSNAGGTPPITGAQYAGVRTDFMDVQFQNFRATSM